MRFDHYEDDAGNLFADGDHEVEIHKVKAVKTKAGEDRTIVTLRDTSGVFDDVDRWFNPSDKKQCQLAIKMLAALGLPRETPLNIDLVGRRVVITTRQGTNKATGQPEVYVNAFAASSAPAFEQYREPEPAKAPAKRTPTQKADAASGTTNSDDIPF